MVSHQLLDELEDKLDPLQVAFQRQAHIMKVSCFSIVTKQPYSTHTPKKILLMDFSSTFNTVNDNILLQRFCELQVHPALIFWIKDGPQHVFYMVLNPIQ